MCAGSERSWRHGRCERSKRRNWTAGMICRCSTLYLCNRNKKIIISPHLALDFCCLSAKLSIGRNCVACCSQFISVHYVMSFNHFISDPHLFIVSSRVPCSVGPSYKVRDVILNNMFVPQSFQRDASNSPFLPLAWDTSSHVVVILFILVVRLNLSIQYNSVLLEVVCQDSVFLLL